MLDAETCKKIREALTRQVQSTDKAPLKVGSAVEYLVIPDSKQKLQYWEPNGTVISVGGKGRASNKLVVIRRANGTVQEVARQRVRTFHVPNLLQLSAIDVKLLSDEVKAALAPQLEQLEPKPISHATHESTTTEAQALRKDMQALLVAQKEFVETQKSFVLGFENVPTVMASEQAGAKAQRRRQRFDFARENRNSEGEHIGSDPPQNFPFRCLCGRGFLTRRQLAQHCASLGHPHEEDNTDAPLRRRASRSWLIAFSWQSLAHRILPSVLRYA